MPEVSGVETALNQTAEQVEQALRSAAAVTRELRKARAGAAAGQLRDLRRALASASALAAELSASARDAEQSLALDEQQELSSGAYARELLAAAAERGIAMVQDDGQLLCYPSIIRLLPGDAALAIDKKRDRRLRPSTVIDRLAAAQTRPPRFAADRFLESLATAYDYQIASQRRAIDAVVPLVEIWKVLTLLPGQSRDYSQPEFARDLYRLDQSGVKQTRAGRTVRWSASTGTRGGGVLTTVARSGQQQTYWGVSFTSTAS